MKLFLSIVVLAVAAAQSSAQSGHSVARQWNEKLLESIRRDFARPTVHARNLFHVSAAMWDAWATYDQHAHAFLFPETHASADTQAAREESISFASYRMLRHRFASSPGFAVMSPQYLALMIQLGYDPSDTSMTGDSPAAIGNRIAQGMIAFGLADGANEANSYANTTYQPVNPPLIVALPGNPGILDVNRWQPLALSFFIDQNGQIIPGGYPPFLSPEWGRVAPFAMNDSHKTTHVRNNTEWNVYQDPGPPPYAGTAGEVLNKHGFEMVVTWSSHLDPTDGVMVDASPRSVGNATMPSSNFDYESFYDHLGGGDSGTGRLLNPVTGQPYAEQMVRRGDYARVLAEFWADGPSSETPPGHWFSIYNAVSDHPAFERRMGGTGPVLAALEFDVKSYLTIGGAMHDAAVCAWSAKGWYDFVRPVSAIRRMCGLGQCTDASQPSYHANGVNLEPGFIELVTEASTAVGERHEDLAGYEGKIAVRAWQGPSAIDDPVLQTAGVAWILGESWWPYQRPTFVTPPFAGYVSGHSTFSRTAAEVMTRITGSEYFPGGMGEFHCEQNQYLVFENGPSTDVDLQWATYGDASDQCSLSRIWGGIHPPCDDIPGRLMGKQIGPRAFSFAQSLFGENCAGDLDGDAMVDGVDLALVLSDWGSTGSGDIDGDGTVTGADLAIVLGSWGACP
ncbi:MAG: hypothetical protein EXS00_06100 [Phycisphaerales bacterium]|nr:hypothetical protein [Phycisphaerales bacterium]